MFRSRVIEGAAAPAAEARPRHGHGRPVAGGGPAALNRPSPRPIHAGAEPIAASRAPRDSGRRRLQIPAAGMAAIAGGGRAPVTLAERAGRL